MKRSSEINRLGVPANGIPPAKWVVDGFLPAGLSILAGGVFYLALEDTLRRLHDRIESSTLIEPNTDDKRKGRIIVGKFWHKQTI